MNENARPIPETSSTPIGTQSAGDIAVAVRNAAKLGLSLTLTWTLALIVRIQLPRHLGPISFGNLNFAESFSAAFFVLIGFGIETYVQKEISIHPERASDFFGGIVVARTLLGVVLFGVMAATLVITGRPSYLHGVMLVAAATQYLMCLSNLLSSMLRASTNVDVLATVNVASKVLWAVGIVIGIAVKAPLIGFAIPAMVGELLRVVILWRATRNAMGLRWHVDVGATTRVLIASFPYFTSSIAVTLVTRLDVSMLEFISPGPEVGWYGAASGLASLAMLFYPVVSWILMPLLARANHRSRDEFSVILRRAIEALMVVTFPLTLIIALGAEFWIALAFGKPYAPGALSLRILAPMFIATYACAVLSIGNILIGRPWIVTGVSLVGIALQATLAISTSVFMKRLGPGGAGGAAAIGVVGMELVTMSLLFWSMGRLAIDRRSLTAVLKSILVVLVVVLIDHFLRPLGPIRLVIDVAAYVVVALVVRVERIEDIRVAIAIVRSRGKPADVSAT